MIDEPEILDGVRAWAETQEAFSGPVATELPITTEIGWYSTAIDEHEGAFAVVKSGGPLEHLVGDIVRVKRHERAIFVYVIGGANIPNDLALARVAYLHIADLSEEESTVRLQVVA